LKGKKNKSPQDVAGMSELEAIQNFPKDWVGISHSYSLERYHLVQDFHGFCPTTKIHQHSHMTVKN